MAIKLLVILMIGAPAMAVLPFEVVLNAVSLFNHSKFKLPHKLEKYLRFILVTPDMHRVHHSIHPEKTNSHYGFTVPWWEHLFSTYTAQPRDGQTGMTTESMHLGNVVNYG